MAEKMKKKEREKDGSKIRIESDFEKYFKLDKLNEKVLERGSRTLKINVSDEAGHEVDLELPLEVYEVWKHSGEYFVRGGRIATDEDVVSALEKVKIVENAIEDQISNTQNEGKRGLLGAIKESILRSTKDAITNLIFVPDENNRIHLRERFKEEFAWEKISIPLAKLALRMNGYEGSDENIQKVLERMGNEFKGLEHVVEYNSSLKGILQEGGVKIKSIKINTSKGDVEIVEKFYEKEVGSSTKIEAETSRTIKEIINSNFNPQEIGSNTVSREEYGETINKVSGLIPEKTKETYGDKTDEILTTLAEVMLAETREIMKEVE